jgi:hypothetical protein
LVLSFLTSPLQRESSAAVIVSIGVIVMLAIEWSGRVKCLAIGVSLRVIMLDLWSVSLSHNRLNVSPTYCLLHTLHVIRYITLQLLQSNLLFILYCLRVYALQKVSVTLMCLQHLHRAPIHLNDPPCSRGPVGILFLRGASSSFKFLFLEKADIIL